jgi:hypothetical protein
LKNFWQDYRVFPDRVELRCWMLFTTFVIPAEDILDVEVHPFSIGDMFKGKVKLIWWVLKLDWSDLCEHVRLRRKSGLIKHLRFTPDNPVNFVAACQSIRPKP